MATMTTSWKNYAKYTWKESSGATVSFYIDARYSSQSTANNTTTVYTRLRTTLDVGTISGSGYSFSCTYCDTVSGSGVWNFATETITSSSAKTITHNTDGTKSITLSSTVKNTYWGLNKTFSATVDLPKIDRLATVTSTKDFTDEENPELSFNNPAGFTIKPWLIIKDNAGTSVYSLSRTTGITSPYTWSLSDSERTAMRNATNKQKSYKVQIGVDTYNGSTKLGNNYKEQTMTYVNAEPSQSTTFTETNSKVISVLGTSNANTIIQNVSQLKLTSTPTVKKGATVSKVTFEHNALSTDDPTSPYEQTYVPVNSKFKVTITDSRGYSTPTEYTKSIVAYVPIDISSHSFKRQSPTSSNIILNAEIRYKQATFGSKANVPTIQWKLGASGTLKTLSSSNYTIDSTNNKIKISNLVLENVLNYKNPGDFYLYANDLLTEDKENAFTVPKGIPTFDAGEHDFKVNGELYVADQNGQNKANISDLIKKLQIMQNTMTIGLASDTSYTAPTNYSSTTLALTVETGKSGTLLSQSNNGIKIGKGISKVVTTGNIITQSSTSAYGIRIAKNGAYVAESFTNPDGSSAFHAITLPPIVIDVVEGDIITLILYINDSGKSKTIKAYSGRGTYLTVMAIQ